MLGSVISFLSNKDNSSKKRSNESGLIVQPCLTLFEYLNKDVLELSSLIA